VVERGGRPLLVVQKAVEPLLRSLDVVRQEKADLSRLGELMMHFDLECPLLSLPAVFGTTMDTVPWTGAYLGAEPTQVAARWAQFPNTGAGPRIGLAWAGNPNYRADKQRSVRLETLLPLLRTPGFTWISLQKGETVADQIGGLPADVHVLDGSSNEQDLSETAALLATLDAVVTTDTCIAHLAGAMNKPVWILLPHLSDWRWMQERETTPWYPSARLLRQKMAGDWNGVFERAVGELEAFRRVQWRAAS
jgi:hypothetical protein